MYDFDKEHDREFLREAGKLLQARLLEAERTILQLQLVETISEEIRQKLTEELLNLRRRVFNSKQERQEKNNGAGSKKKKRQGNLPHNQGQNSKLESGVVKLEEKEIVHEITQEACPHCGEKLNEMNNCFEESNEFEVVERLYVLKRHKRKKYNCRHCQKIITAAGGVKLTPGSEFSIQIASQVACDKYEDHLPLERQRKQMERAGLNVEVKTLFGFTEHLYNRLLPMEELIRQDVLSEKWVHIDESPVDFYNPEKSKGFVWSMSNPRGAYYRFEATRSGLVAKEMLKSFDNGCVVTDGFSGYDFLDREENIKHAFCWAHVRRKFFEAIAHDKKAEQMVDLIDDLYDVEHEAKTIEDLVDLRGKKSFEIVKKIDQWIAAMDGHYLESSSMGKAIFYYLERKPGLHHFLFDKNVPIDNNMAERRQRCPVMGRKNFLHFKSINGADIGVFFYSVIESCKGNGLNARAFIIEMANRSARGLALESPYGYACHLNDEIKIKLSKELAEQLVPKG